MINEQIVLWIKSNLQFYAKQRLKEHIQQSKESVQITDLFLKVISRTFQVMEDFLKDEKEAAFENLIVFNIIQSQENKTSNHKYPSFYWMGKIRDQILVPTKSIGSQQALNKIENYQLCKEVGSFLWLQPEFVKQILQIYTKAICDLVASGKQLTLNFGFCLINLSRNKAKLRFSTQLLKYFEQKQNEMPITNKRTHLWLEVPSKESSISQGERWSKNWDLIKQSNLFKYPSLNQIQKHLDKGYNLQLKFKQRYS